MVYGKENINFLDIDERLQKVIKYKNTFEQIKDMFKNIIVKYLISLIRLKFSAHTNYVNL